MHAVHMDRYVHPENLMEGACMAAVCCVPNSSAKDKNRYKFIVLSSVQEMQHTN